MGAKIMENCKGCGNPLDLCICDELEYYDEEVDNYMPEYYEPPRIEE